MKKTEILFEKEYDGEYQWLPMKDVPKEVLVPENLIMIDIEQGYHDNNGWNEGLTRIRIAIEREQTQEEKDEMKKYFAELRAKSKEERRLQYLELKKEFE